MGNNINPEKINSSAPSLLRHVQSTPLFQQHQFINDAPPDHEEIGLMGSSTQSNAHPYNDNHEQDDDVACFTDSTASINNIRKRSQTLGLNRRTSSSRHLKQPSLSDSSSSPIMPISPNNNNNQLYGNPSSSPFPTSSTPISIPTSTTRNDDPNSPNVLSASSVLATSFSSSSPNVQRTTEHQINAALSSSSPNNTPKQQFSTKRNIPLLNLPPRPTSLSSNASPRHHHNEPRYSSWVGTSPKQAHLNPIESAAITASNYSVSVSNVMMMSNNNTITSDETSKDGLSRIIYMNRNGNNNFQLDASPKNSSPSYSPQLWTNTSLFKQTSNNLQQEPVAIIISKSTPISPHHNDERNAKLSRKANSNKSSLGSTSSSKSGGRTNRSHSTALLTPRGVNMLSPRGVNGIPYSPRGSLSPRTNFTRPTNGAASTTPTTSNNGNHNQRSYPISFDDVTENDIHGEENDSDLEDMNISEISTNHNPKITYQN
ncbi:hypothetical protein C9374_008001 [Naegleria lovaniensis]|uniref:Uncharacterized protein n=1 Tax=Naegleria lovaniensis TaxID=51637 RepID=A0AA88KIG1_NAELO|nr:uncharacterized protein C9374_008001 [Naegleria lovaniensis]KAG2378853.1 hypothetical protein C9374_008001 [Naegleria lovaniensis]